MKSKLTLNNQQQELLHLGNKIKTQGNKELYYCPLFFERIDGDTFFEMGFKDLPEGIKKFVVENWMKDIKEYIKNNKI